MEAFYSTANVAKAAVGVLSYFILFRKKVCKTPKAVGKFNILKKIKKVNPFGGLVGEFLYPTAYGAKAAVGVLATSFYLERKFVKPQRRLVSLIV